MELADVFGASFLLIGKVLILLVLFVYIIFAVVVLKQVRLMTATLSVDFDKVIEVMAFIHLLAAIIVFVVALSIL